MSSILTQRDASGTGVHGVSQMFEHDLELNFEVDLGAKRNLADAGIGPGSTPLGISIVSCLFYFRLFRSNKQVWIAVACGGKADAGASRSPARLGIGRPRPIVDINFSVLFG